jgi:hypothetical protein
VQSTFWVFLIAISVHHTLSLARFVEHQTPHVISKLTESILKRNCSQNRSWESFSMDAEGIIITPTTHPT